MMSKSEQKTVQLPNLGSNRDENEDAGEGELDVKGE